MSIMKEFNQKIIINHLDGSSITFSNGLYIAPNFVCDNEPPLRCRIETEHCGSMEFYLEDLKSIKIDDRYIMTDDYETIETVEISNRKCWIKRPC